MSLRSSLNTARATKRTDSRASVNSGASSVILSALSGGMAGDASAVISICESRGALSEVGIAVYDSSQAVCHVGQICDLKDYSLIVHFLTIYPPIRVLICVGSRDSTESGLLAALQDVLVDDAICFLPRSDFNENLGMKWLNQLATKESAQSMKIGLQKKYFAFAAISALFTFIQNAVGLDIEPNVVQFNVAAGCDIIPLDYRTIRALNLIPVAAESSGKPSLYAAICHCHTRMGKRLLKSNILQPFVNAETINARYDAVDELLRQPQLLGTLDSCLRELPDVDAVIKFLIHSSRESDSKIEEKPAVNVLNIYQLLNRVVQLRSVLEGSVHSHKLVELSAALARAELQEMLGRCADVLNEDVANNTDVACANIHQHQRLYLIKPAVDVLLDVARRTFEETQADVHEYCKIWSEQAGIDIRVKYHLRRGFFFAISKSDLQSRDIGSITRHYVSCKSEYHFSTIEMAKLNERLKESMNEITAASQNALHGIILEFRSKIGYFRTLALALSELDVIVSFANYACQHQAVRPEFSENMSIKNAKHPILLSLKSYSSVVGNDYVYDVSGHGGMVVVTGSNMSGKSTYIQQVVHMCVLAQMGCFISADYVALPIYTKFLVRVGSDDDLRSNASNFGTEMSEVAYIMERTKCLGDGAGSRGLVIIDELGRGTGLSEGVAIAMAVCEALLRHSRATVFVATHFGKLAKFLEGNENVSLVRLQSSLCAMKKNLRYTYRAVPGRNDIQNYGLVLAEMMRLPQELCTTASALLQRVKDAEGEGVSTSGLRSQIAKRKLILKTYERMKKIDAQQKESVLGGTRLQAMRAAFEEELQKLSEV